MDRTLAALFDKRSDAISAADDLVVLGIPRQQISVVSASEPPEEGAVAGGGQGTAEEHRGFWDSLADLFIPEEDASTYREAVNRGGATVIARVDESRVGRAVEIFENHDAVDLDAREQEWRAEGSEAPHAGKRARRGRVRIHGHGAGEPVSEDIDLRDTDPGEGGQKTPQSGSR